jgi:NADH-quinone oxidoreductase subunit J
VQPAYWVTFCVAAAIVVLSAVMMITRRNAVHAALWLALNFAGIAVLYLTLHAPFIALLQVTIYAGAIMVLFLFVIMLLNVPAAQPRRRRCYAAMVGAVLAVALGVGMGMVFAVCVPSDTALTKSGEGFYEGTVESVGASLFSQHAFSFELVSVLLVAAMVGVVVLGIRSRRGHGEGGEG